MNFNNIPPVTKYLLIINVVVFLLVYYILPTFGFSIEKNFIFLAGWFPFTEHFQFSQIITHMFMHGASFNDIGEIIGGNWSHLFFNMFGLYMFGSAVEGYFREKNFLILYMLSGLGAFILHFFISYLIDDINTPVVGASGAIFGITTAFAVLYPNTPMMLIFLPVPIKAKYFVAIYLGIELFSGINGYQTGVAHFAHIGGAIIGFLLTRYWIRNRFQKWS